MQVDDAIYNAIDAQREYLGHWLQFVDSTTSVAVTQTFVDSSLNAEDKTFTIRKGEQFIGLIGFKATDKANCKTEIGYWLSGEYQGRGSLNEDYCCYCYKDGAFTQDCTMDGMIEHCIKYLDEFNGACDTKLSKDEAIAQMCKHFPKLKRWANKK